MFPGTQKIDEQIADLRSRGLTVFTSQKLRTLIIEQAAAWFPGHKKGELAEEHLVERRMIPPKAKRGPNFLSGKLHKKVLSMIPRS